MKTKLTALVKRFRFPQEQICKLCDGTGTKKGQLCPRCDGYGRLADGIGNETKRMKDHERAKLA